MVPIPDIHKQGFIDLIDVEQNKTEEKDSRIQRLPTISKLKCRFMVVDIIQEQKDTNL